MASNSLGRYSDIGITTVQAFLDYVATINGTTISLDNTYSYLDNDADWVNGSFVVANSTTAANNDIRLISSTAYASNQVVLATSIDGLEVDDQIAIIPAPLIYLCLESESIKETINWEDTECLQTWESTHHTPLTVDCGGDLGVFIGEESDALDILMSAAIGSRSVGAGLAGAGSIKYYTPGATIEYITVVMQRGNSVSLQAYCGMMVDNLTLDQPAGALGTARTTFIGGFGIQEIGGAGQAFDTTDFWSPPATPPDPKRMHFRHLVVSSATVPKRYAESASVTFSRNPAIDRRLGDYYAFEPSSSKFETTGTLVQWFEDDNELTEWRGDTAAISSPATRTLEYLWTGTATVGTYLNVTAYSTAWQDSSEPIVTGRIKETLTWKAIYDTGEAKQCYVTFENNSTAVA